MPTLNPLRYLPNDFQRYNQLKDIEDCWAWLNHKAPYLCNAPERKIVVLVGSPSSGMSSILNSWCQRELATPQGAGVRAFTFVESDLYKELNGRKLVLRPGEKHRMPGEVFNVHDVQLVDVNDVVGNPKLKRFLLNTVIVLCEIDSEHVSPNVQQVLKSTKNKHHVFCFGKERPANAVVDTVLGQAVGHGTALQPTLPSWLRPMKVPLSWLNKFATPLDQSASEHLKVAASHFFHGAFRHAMAAALAALAACMLQVMLPLFQDHRPPSVTEQHTADAWTDVSYIRMLDAPIVDADDFNEKHRESRSLADELIHMPSMRAVYHITKPSTTDGIITLNDDATAFLSGIRNDRKEFCDADARYYQEVRGKKQGVGDAIRASVPRDFANRNVTMAELARDEMKCPDFPM